mmetsp:Transcript_86660/g.242776  ORF Transcript_86660/g.242776 Transcript_86660/m.242776 type:complete len:226 (-) Transcript_86660:942-1619(-)
MARCPMMVLLMSWLKCNCSMASFSWHSVRHSAAKTEPSFLCSPAASKSPSGGALARIADGLGVGSLGTFSSFRTIPNSSPSSCALRWASSTDCTFCSRSREWTTAIKPSLLTKSPLSPLALTASSLRCWASTCLKAASVASSICNRCRSTSNSSWDRSDPGASSSTETPMSSDSMANLDCRSSVSRRSLSTSALRSRTDRRSSKHLRCTSATSVTAACCSVSAFA